MSAQEVRELLGTSWASRPGPAAAKGLDLSLRNQRPLSKEISMRFAVFGMKSYFNVVN